MVFVYQCVLNPSVILIPQSSAVNSSRIHEDYVVKTFHLYLHIVLSLPNVQLRVEERLSEVSEIELVGS